MLIISETPTIKSQTPVLHICTELIKRWYCSEISVSALSLFVYLIKI